MRPLLLVPAVLLSVTACSGSSPEEPPDPKPAFVDAATQVCATAEEEFTALTPPTGTAEFGPYVQQTAEIAERAQRDLAALEPPPDDRAELERQVLDPFASLVEDGKAFAERVRAAGADESALLALLPERPTAAGIDREYLREYGLESCAEALGRLG